MSCTETLRARRLVLFGGLALLGLYQRRLRHLVLRWGATEEEAAARLPGDELLERPDGVSTRAISIAAPPAAVWPWLAQMGPSPRGGAYTYDWIENLLGLNMHAAYQPQPLPPPPPDRPRRDVADGAGFARDGAQDAAGDQAARRGPGHFTRLSASSGGCLITDLAAQPKTWVLELAE